MRCRLGANLRDTQSLHRQGLGHDPARHADDVDRAVRAAHAPSPRRLGDHAASDRGLLLHRLADPIAANAKRLADLEVRDNGKLRAEMLGQIRYLPRWFHYYGGLADKIEGEVTPIEKKGMFHYIAYEPVGVVAAITPWNSPLLLTAGSSRRRWRPATRSSSSLGVRLDVDARIGQLIGEAGFPPGVVNVVTGLGQEAASRWSSIRWSRDGLHRRRGRRAQDVRRRRARSSACRWSWAASRRTSSSRTPTSTTP